MAKLRAIGLTLLTAMLLTAFGAQAWTQPRPAGAAGGGPPVRLRTGDVHLGTAETRSALAAAADNRPRLYLVQFQGPVRPEDKQALQALGVEVGDYIPENTFIVRMDQHQARRVASLPAVRAVGRYTARYKLDPALAQVKGDVTVRVVGFGGSPKGSMAALAAAGGRILSAGGRTAVGRLTQAQLAALSQSEDVVYLEPVRPFRLFNDQAAGIIRVDAVRQHLGLDGTGQVVGVADTGLDTGDRNRMHRDLQDRIQDLFSLGRPGDASDPHGHGTHVAGSIVGTGAASDGKIKGMAPGARLVFQSVLDEGGGLGGLPDDLGQLFRQAYAAGARIHSNSWGVPATAGGTTYDTNAAAVDRFVWENRDMTILFAAGNDGDHDRDGQVNYGTVSTPGTAKNAITVGASENSRPDRGSHGDNPAEVAVFSSRGLTADNRLKPDVVAPGTWILSVKSSRAPEQNFWQGYDENYAYMGGTSMATPITAGTVALLRQYFVEKLGITPTASLIKAALINGAVPIAGSHRDYGWGRVDLEQTLAAGNRFENEPAALNTGEKRTFTYEVQPGQPFKVTLVWTDYPGSPAAGKALVNDLDLEVRTPDGTVVRGNHMLGNAPDRVNNVEQVRIDQPVAGTYTVTVTAANVPQGPQPFSLAVSGRLGDPPPTDPPADREPPTVRITEPADGATVRGRITLRAQADDTGSGIARVEFYVGTYHLATRTAAPYEATWDTTGAPNGPVQVTVRAYDRAGNSAESTVTVTVDNPAEPPPQGGTGRTIVTGRAPAWGGLQRAYFESGAGEAVLTLERTGWGQMQVTVLGPDGRQVASGGLREAAAGLRFRTPAAGSYTVLLQAYPGVAEWRLTIAHPTAPGRKTATFTGTVSAEAGPVRQLPFTVTRDGVVTLTLAWTGGADLDLYLTDRWGWPVAAGDGGTHNPEGVSARLRAGAYTAYVVAAGGEARFTLTVDMPE